MSRRVTSRPGTPDAAGDGSGVVHLDEDEGCGPRGRGGGEELGAVVGPVEAHRDGDGVAPGEALGDGAGVQDALASCPPCWNVTTPYPHTVQVFEWVWVWVLGVMLFL